MSRLRRAWLEGEPEEWKLKEKNKMVKKRKEREKSKKLYWTFFTGGKGRGQFLMIHHSPTLFSRFFPSFFFCRPVLVYLIVFGRIWSFLVVLVTFGNVWLVLIIHFVLTVYLVLVFFIGFFGKLWSLFLVRVFGIFFIMFGFKLRLVMFGCIWTDIIILGSFGKWGNLGSRKGNLKDNR